MDTLLIANQDIALIGDTNGKVRTELRAAGYSVEEWLQILQRMYKEHDRAPANSDRVRVVKPRVDESSGVVRMTDEYYLMKDYTDEGQKLRVRAAYVNPSGKWVVAR